MIDKHTIGRRTGYLESFRAHGTSLRHRTTQKISIVCKNCGFNRRPLTKLEDGTHECFHGCER